MTAARLADRGAIVAAARGWIGTPYVHQASLKGAGCDCLGLLRGVWRELIGPEPEAAPAYSPDWAEIAGRETLLETARRHLVAIAVERAEAGCVLMFRWRADLPVKHCGILTRPGRMIHAWERAGVDEVALGAWQRRIAAAFDFPAIFTAVVPGGRPAGGETG